jgi:arsenite methyltransferase
MSSYLNKNFDLNSPELVEVLDEMPLWSAPFGLQLLDGINYMKNINAVDIGFGAGFPLTELAMRLGESCKVYGIDPWEAAIDRANKKIARYGISNIEILKSSAEQIPLEDSSIQLIVSNNGLNNVTDLAKCLHECHRIQIKGGQFIQSINLEDSFKEFYSILKNELRMQGYQQFIPLVNQHIYSKRMPLSEYLAHIKRSGYKVDKVKKHKFYYRFSDGTAFFNHYFIQLAFLSSWKTIVPEEAASKIFHQIENQLNAIAERKNGISLTVPYAIIDCKAK